MLDGHGDEGVTAETMRAVKVTLLWISVVMPPIAVVVVIVIFIAEAQRLSNRNPKGLQAHILDAYGIGHCRTVRFDRI